MSRPRKEKTLPGKALIGQKIIVCPRGCGTCTSTVQAMMYHLRVKHGLTRADENFPDLNEYTQIITETGTKRLVEEDKKESKSKGKLDPSTSKKGGKMTTKKETEGDPFIDKMDKSRLKGQLRQLAKAVGSLSPEERTVLYPELEVIKDAIKRLSHENITVEEFEEIEHRYDTELKPTIESFVGKIEEVGKKGKSHGSSPDEDTEMTRIELKSIIMQYLRLISRQTEKIRDELFKETELLRSLNARVSKEDITKDELDNIKIKLENEILPFVDERVKKRKKFSYMDDDDEEEIEDLEMSKRELKAMEIKRRKLALEREIEEERISNQLFRRQLLEQQKNLFGGMGNNGLVPVQTIVYNPETGEPEKDEYGNIKTTVTYRPAQQQNIPLDPNTIILMGMIDKMGWGRKQEDSSLTQFLLEEMKTNRELLMEIIRNKNSSNPDDILLKVQNENQKTLIEVLKTQDQKNPEIVQTINDLREQNMKLMQMHYESQLGQIRKELEQTKRYASRDTLAELEQDRERLIRLGLVSPRREGEKNPEEVAVEKSTEVVREGMQRVENSLDDLKELLKPFAEAQAEIMKRQAGLTPAPMSLFQQPQQPLAGTPGMEAPRIPIRSDEEKITYYQQLLANLEEEE